MDNNRIFLTAFFGLVLYWMIVLFNPFLLNIAIASLLAIATIPLHVKIAKFFKNQVIASLATTLLLCLLFFAPMIYAISALAKLALSFNPDYINNTIDYFSNYKIELPESISFLEPKIKESLQEFDVATLSSKILANIAKFGKMGAGFFTDVLMIIVFFFFANAYGKDMVSYFKSVLPMDDDEVESIFLEVANVMSVVFYSILATAFFEGALFAIAGSFFGYDAILLGILYGFASLIPVVGGALMWIPISAYEFANGNTFAAIFMALYSVIVISIIADTFIKPLIIKYINQTLVKVPTKINELLIFFAIVAGLASFGFWGMILGPAITTLFLSVLKLYKVLKEEKTRIVKE